MATYVVKNDACSKLFELKWLEPKSLRTMTIIMMVITHRVAVREGVEIYLVGVGMGMRGCVRPYASVGLLLDRIG